MAAPAQPPQQLTVEQANVITRVVVGNTHSTGFTSSWDPDALGDALERWAAAGVLGASEALHPDDVADAVLNVLTSGAHISDIAILDRPASVAGPAEAEE